MNVGVVQCVQAAPSWRSQILARTSLDLCFLMKWEGAAEVQEVGPGF